MLDDNYVPPTEAKNNLPESLAIANKYLKLLFFTGLRCSFLVALHGGSRHDL